jgi:hypothetical protein
VWPDSAAALDRMRTELSTALEKLATREKFLNETFEHLLSQYRAARRGMLESQEMYNKRSELVGSFYIVFLGGGTNLHRIQVEISSCYDMSFE